MTHVTTAMVAEIFGVTDRTVRLWGQGGCPKAGRGQWDLREVVPWWAENIFTGDGGADGEALAKAKQDYWMAKAETEQAKARNETVKADLAEGKVMPADEIIEQWAWRVGCVSSDLGQIPLRLAPFLVGKAEAEIRQILEKRMWEIRDNYSRTGRFCPPTKGLKGRPAKKAPKRAGKAKK